MAVVKNLMVRVGADFSSITQQSKKAAQSVKGMGQEVKTAGSGMSASFSKIAAAGAKITAAIAIARGIYSAVQDDVEAYKISAEQQAKLATTMRNTMKASDAQIESVRRLASEQQALGVVEDDVQAAGAAALASYLEMPESLEAAIPAMNDMIAKNYGLEASTDNAVAVARMMGKALEGQTGTLTRYGLTVSEAQALLLKYGTEAERVATLTEIIEQSAGGMNAALAQTPTGQFQQLKNSFGDVKEQIGEAALTFASTFVPVLQRIVGWLSTAAGWCQRLASNFRYIFGGKVQSNAVAVAGASADTADSIEDIADAYGKAGGASSKFQRQMMGIDTLNRLSSSGGGGGGGGGALEEAMEDMADYEETLYGMNAAAEETEATHGWLVEKLKSKWDSFTSRMEHAGDLFKDPQKFFQDEWQIWKDNWEHRKDQAIEIGVKIKDKATELAAKWKEEFEPVKEGFLEIGARIKDKATELAAKWKEEFEPIKEGFMEIGAKIKDKARTLMERWREEFTPVKEGFLEIGVRIATRAGEIWEQIRSWFQGRALGLSVYYDAPNNGFQQAVVSALGLAGWPRLSFAAKGGIVDQATLFGSTVVGEAGKEAIIPLERNTGWMDGVANRIEQGLGSEMVAALNSGKNEQNSLLREQNRLLRALLEKEAVIRPSVAMGQVMKKSADMYARSAG